MRCTTIFVLAIVLVCVAQVVAQAAVVSVDFNVQDTASPFPVSPTKSGEEPGPGVAFTGQAGTWNALLVGDDLDGDTATTPNSMNAPLTTGALLAGDGSGTNATFTFGIGASGGSPINYQVFNNGLGSTALRQDMVAIGNGQNIAWRIDGLLAGESYNLVAFGQQYINLPFNPASFTANALSPNSTDAQNDAEFLGLIADGNGSITGTMFYTDSNLGTWSGFQIEGLFVMPVPEPTTLGMLTIGLVGLNCFRSPTRRLTCFVPSVLHKSK